MYETLDRVKANRIVKVVDFVVPKHHIHIPQYIVRLQEMGVLKGEIIEVRRNTGIGPIEINVKGTKLAIGRGIASRIIVEEVNEQWKHKFS
ncbi:FeoA family protein [Caldisericum sp. AR60]|uniref:FeoA family protein n=1 Tax=Caldisericum sp. AR60 TaxID=3397852 RepID=UPI0039FBEB63